MGRRRRGGQVKMQERGVEGGGREPEVRMSEWRPDDELDWKMSLPLKKIKNRLSRVEGEGGGLVITLPKGRVCGGSGDEEGK